MNSYDKRVLVTGATGLIGRELACPLLQSGFEVYAITIDKENPNNGIHWIEGSLFDERFVCECVGMVKPTHLLNMAWATTGDYLSSSVNFSFLKAGINLAQAFVENGGSRAVYAGTCFEYQFSDGPLKEDSPLDPARNEYTFCKIHLSEIASRIFVRAGVSFGYGRIFNAFGRGEPATRLTGMIINSIQQGRDIIIRGGPLHRDYIYSKDIANAFAGLLDSSVEGAVNIATGKPLTVGAFALALARHMGREDLIVFRDDCDTQPRYILADVTRLLQEVGYKPKYDIENAVKDILSK